MSFKTVQIGDLFPQILIGGTPSRGNPKYFGGPHVWVSIRDMEGKYLIVDSNEKLSDKGIANSNCKRIQKGSLLFSFKLTVGRVAFAGVDLYTNEAIAAFDPEDANRSKIDLEYLFLILPAIAKADTSINCMGAALLNKEKIAQLEIPLPPIDQQRRIAAQLKAQLAAVDEARQAAQAQISDSKRLIPAILEAAFAETKDGDSIKIGDAAKTVSGTTPSRSRKDYWEPPKYPWVKTGEVVFNPITRTEEYISEKALEDCSLSVLPPGTVLIAMYGQGKTRGQSALLQVAATTNQACIAILPCEAFDPEYLQFWLSHSYEVLRTQSESRGGNQPNLNGEILNQFTVPLTPRKRQETLAQQIKASVEEAERLQSALNQQMNDLELLPARLFAQAFGEN